jgi:glycerophosphoryl diester phosphodiesterase
MLLYGHRGARGEAPENTEAAFRYARALYLDGVQLDVRLSSDEELVVIHDETVDRTTNGHGRVANFKAAKLASLDARADWSVWPESVGVPTLDDAFDACSGIPRIMISIQPDEPKRLRKVCDLIMETLERRWIPDRVVVLSNSQPALEQMARIAPTLSRGQAGWFETLDELQNARGLRCKYIAVPLSTGSESLVRTAQNHGISVIGWLANSPKEILTFATWGVDAIVSDFPSMAKRAIGSR